MSLFGTYRNRNCPLVALGAWPSHAIRFDGKAVMAGEIDKLQVEFSGGQADLFHVVVEHFLEESTVDLLQARFWITYVKRQKPQSVR